VDCSKQNVIQSQEPQERFVAGEDEVSGGMFVPLVGLQPPHFHDGDDVEEKNGGEEVGEEGEDGDSIFIEK